MNPINRAYRLKLSILFLQHCERSELKNEEKCFVYQMGASLVLKST